MKTLKVWDSACYFRGRSRAGDARLKSPSASRLAGPSQTCIIITTYATTAEILERERKKADLEPKCTQQHAAFGSIASLQTSLQIIYEQNIQTCC